MSTSRARSGVLDGILERAEPRDLELADIAGAERDLGLAREADAGRGARGDEIARRQRHDIGQVLDDVAEVEDEILGIAVLHERPVDPGLELEHMGVRDLCPVRDVRAYGGQRIAHLAGAPLARVELEITGARVVDDGVAENIVEGLVLWDEARGLADDHAQLDLPVEGLLPAGPEDGLARVQDGIVPLREDRRLLGHGVPRLLGVVSVVETYADELARVVDRGMEPDRARGMGQGLEAPPLDGLHHARERVLARRAPLQEAARALREERGGNGRRS